MKSVNFESNKNKENMKASVLKKQLHQAIDTTEDQVILEAVYSILNRHNTMIQLKPMSEAEFFARIEKSEKQIRQGHLIDHEDIKKLMRKHK